MKRKDNQEKTYESLRMAADVISYNEESDTFEAVISTDAPVMLQGWKYSDKFETFDEVLRHTPESIRSQRIDSGLPLFPSHWERDSTDIIGISTDYRFEEGRIIASFKFGARADDMMKNDLKSGVLRSVSVGVNIYSVERTEDATGLRYTATDWEPKHVAFAPEPADVNCTVRSMAQVSGVYEVETEKEEKNDILKELFTK